jgi:hypothetical protein
MLTLKHDKIESRKNQNERKASYRMIMTIDIVIQMIRLLMSEAPEVISKRRKMAPFMS